jgi:tetratricopeptide (TPR) repeat protein
VEHVADWAQGPVAVLTTARPELFEMRPTWGGGKRNTASIYLDPLSEAEAEEMLDDLLSGSLAPELQRTILERSEGNPLYVEEIVRKLIDDGVLRATDAARWEVAGSVAEVELPRSVQALIATRLDALPDDEKAALQDASVVGRVFWLGAVAALAGREAVEVRDALGRLRVKELIVPHDPSSFSDEYEFSFRHNLIRDGAYDSLPKALRAEKHEGVATWAERRAGDRAEEIAELIAAHLLEALRYVEEVGTAGAAADELRRRAFTWTTAAGQRTAALWQRAEATRWFREAERLAAATGAGAAERAALGRMHVQASWGTDPADEYIRVVRAARAAYEEVGDDRGRAWARARAVLVEMQLGRHDEAEADGRDAVAILEPLGESPELAEAIHVLGWFLWRRGRAGEAEPLLRRSVDMAVRLGAQLVRAEAMQTLGNCLMQVGKTDESLTVMREAYRLAKEVGEFNNLIRITNNLPAQLDLASDYAGAEAVLHEGIELARRAGARPHESWLVGSLADVLVRQGRLTESEALARDSMASAAEVGDRPHLGMRKSQLSLVLLFRGRIDEAQTLQREARPLLNENPEPQGVIFIPMFEGYLALARSDPAAAIAAFEAMVEQLRGFNIAAEPQIFTELARLLPPAGRRDDAIRYREMAAASAIPAMRANVLVIDGLLNVDPVASRGQLAEGAEALDRLGLRLDAARAMIDLGLAMRRAGQDPTATLSAARDLLIGCDARLFLPRAEAALAGAASGPIDERRP